MATFDVVSKPAGQGWTLDVTVSEPGSSTRHEVTLRRADYEVLAGGKGTPEDLVRKSFKFLLAREPKESILARFDLSVISRYFPEFDSAIRSPSPSPLPRKGGED